jgi:hypothetical protein
VATTANLLSEVLAHQFNSGRYSDLIVTWLDQAQKRIYRKSKLRTAQDVYEFDTEADEPEYALPADYARIERVINTDIQNPLLFMEQKDYDDADTSDGTPDRYVIFGTNLFLYPTPNAAVPIRLRYWTLPPTITTETNPVIPDDYSQLLVEYALSKAYQAEHDFDAATYHRSNFDVELLNLTSETTEDSREAPTRVKGCW